MKTNGTMADLKDGDFFIHPKDGKTYFAKMRISEHSAPGWGSELCVYKLEDGCGYPVCWDDHRLAITLLPQS